MQADRQAIEQERGSQDALEQAIQQLGLKRKGKTVQCPEHDDQNPSASVGEHAGVWRVYCHACKKGWDVFDLRAKIAGSDVGAQLKAVQPPKAKATTSTRQSDTDGRSYPSMDAIVKAVPHASNVYYYYDADAQTVQMIVFRIPKEGGKKTFLQASPRGDLWVMKSPDGVCPLYNLPEVSAAQEVVVVEGEKCVQALASVGIVGTTSPMGAGKAGVADWSPLAGKRVWLWPDNDPVDPKTNQRLGIEHMRDVQRRLHEIDPPVSLYWIDPDGLELPPKGDVFDVLNRLSRESVPAKQAIIRGIMDDAQPMGASATVGAIIEDMIAGKRKALPWPWPRMGDLTKALLPGTVTLLCGEASSAKSWMVLQAMCHWHTNGIKAALYALEDDRGYHLYRALAQSAGDARLFDDAYVEAHPDEARAAQAKYAPFLDSFGRCVWEAPGKTISKDDVVEWVRARANAGARIIVVDPVTATMDDDRPWAADLKFIMATKSIVSASGSSLLLVTHPIKAVHGKPSMAALAGGAAYTRFSHTAIWLERLSEPKDLSIVRGEAFGQVMANRIAHIIKARNGKGTGMRIAMTFSSRSLRFIEHGVAYKQGQDVSQLRPTTPDPAHAAKSQAMYAGPPRPAEDQFAYDPPQQEPMT